MQKFETKCEKRLQNFVFFIISFTNHSTLLQSNTLLYRSVAIENILTTQTHTGFVLLAHYAPLSHYKPHGHGPQCIQIQIRTVRNIPHSEEYRCQQHPQWQQVQREVHQVRWVEAAEVSVETRFRGSREVLTAAFTALAPTVKKDRGRKEEENHKRTIKQKTRQPRQYFIAIADCYSITATKYAHCSKNTENNNNHTCTTRRSRSATCLWRNYRTPLCRYCPV